MSEMSATEALALGKSDELLGGGSGVLVLILALPNFQGGSQLDAR